MFPYLFWKGSGRWPKYDSDIRSGKTQHFDKQLQLHVYMLCNSFCVKTDNDAVYFKWKIVFAPPLPPFHIFANFK